MNNSYLDKIGFNALNASKDLSLLNEKKKNKVLTDFCKNLKLNKKNILKANRIDISKASRKGLSKNLIDRLVLSDNKINYIIKSIQEVIRLKDPTQKIISKWKRPNGMVINKYTVPIGVIGVIYESRPNVTSDVATLCFKSGNAVILRGGSEAIQTNKVISEYFRRSLRRNNINENCIQLINNTNRKLVDYMLSKMERFIDVIIPRGGKNLVKKIEKMSNVPTIGHLEGLCHVYIDRYANLNMAKKITLNAKMRNTSICGAAETLLVDKACVKTHLKPILQLLSISGCKIIGDKITKKNYMNSNISLATEQDWKTEYLDSIISVKIVNGVDEAIEHINKYGTRHTDGIVTNNKKNALLFLSKVNSAIVLHNASTQFADGNEFGFGAEVGISTNKLHPRGPVGLEQLVTYKYLVKGNGQIRP
ncbi:MAG: glutamate-5-semialdehyde dehydrogenase [Candidatus Fonsibacter sp.]|nr:glutamate-5-semialdehyde dehydrogenase [Candidatus Fonsibacter sp.]